ncbi:MAG TPA: glutathione peroxidase [Candidatus Baltobacteraceae bacterium]
MAHLTPQTAEIPLRRIDGTETTVGAFGGKTALVVNVASECGLTPQYAGLQTLYDEFKDRGLVVLGFPSNQFGAQEPGTNAQVATFCETRFGVTFPMFEKIDVNGPQRHPLYTALIGDGGDITWNFEKFLVSPDGTVQRFGPKVTPEDPQLRSAVESALA